MKADRATGARSADEGTRSVRVLRVISRLNVGGPARHAAILDDGLRRRGYQTLLVYGSTGSSEGSLEDLVVSRDLPRRKIPQLGRSVSLSKDLRSAFDLLRLVFEYRPDVIHTHTAKAGALGRAAALVYNVSRRRRAVVVHTYHGHVFRGYFGKAGSAVVRLTERILGLVTDRVITLSERQRDEICDSYRIVPRSKAAVVELGLELDALLEIAEGDRSPLRRELGFTDDQVVFGYVGRMVPIKDLPTLIRAFASMADSRVGLALFGDGESREQLEKLVSALGPSLPVRFAGWVSDVAAVYRMLDVAVLSSLNEGTPLSLIEAMAAGKAVVATAVGGVPDLIADGLNGIVVPPGDERRLAEAMARLASDPESRNRMGRCGRLEAAGRFRSSRLVADIDALYRAELARKHGAVPPAVQPTGINCR